MIGFLATGNELVEGDILNTNGQMLAQALVDSGCKIGMHVITSDRDAELQAGLRFLLSHYDTVVTIGGLGPTSDDRTRYALSEVTHCPLVFDETSWQQIVKRYQNLNLILTTELKNVNRQQALFPIGATIFPNKNGSAAGCMLVNNNKTIFMLPGPPNECLPMFEEYVLPVITQQVSNKIKKLSWLLLGVIEGEIAGLIDEVVKRYPVTTGYRIMQPYLEVKIYVPASLQLEQLKADVEKIILPYIVSTNKQTASMLLQTAIEQASYQITIADNATGGLLESLLLTPKTHTKLKFVAANYPVNITALHINILGLEDFWRGDNPCGETIITLQYQFLDKTETLLLKIPFRNHQVCKYAAEYIAWAILQIIKGS